MRTRDEIIHAAAEFAADKPPSKHVQAIDAILDRNPKYVRAKSGFRFMFGQLRRSQKHPESIAGLCYAWTRD